MMASTAGSDEAAHSRGRVGSQSSQTSEMDVPHFSAQMANTHLEHLCLLDMFSNPHTLRNTGIICTIGQSFCACLCLFNIILGGPGLVFAARAFPFSYYFAKCGFKGQLWGCSYKT